MTTRIEYCEQGSAEWLQLRCGLVTASRISDVMAFKVRGGGEKSERTDYRAELIAELLTGSVAEHYVSPEMKYGSEHEAEIRTAYALRKGIFVQQVGFGWHPTIERSGGSPDGITDGGGVEIKIPKTANHLKWIADGICPPEHYDQVQWNIDCFERDTWDFVSGDPRLPERYRLFIVPVPRDDARIAELRDGVRMFLREVDAQLRALDERMPELPRADVPTPDFGSMGLTDADLDAPCFAPPQA